MKFSHARAAILLKWLAASAIFAVPSPVTTDSVKCAFVPEAYVQTSAYAGYLGHRMQINEGRLFGGELSGPNDFFALFKNPNENPGCCGWEGAWAGRFFDACCYSYQYTNDSRMRARIDSITATLKSCQGSDGYLGTYSPSYRWTASDVWIHTYDLISLLHSYQLTGDTATLRACIRIGDLLCATFGPGKKDIMLSCPSWQGMSATAVLMPMVSLYRYTGDQKYRDFGTYVTTTIEETGGSKIISDMLANKDISLDSPKAYEKLCNLMAILELYRITRNPDYLTVCNNAWNNIHAHHHFVSGTSTGDENWTTPDVYKPTRAVETCVDVSWMQFTHTFFQMTGDPKYAEELEHDVYNALLTSQHPVSGNYCYFTALNGRRDPNDATYGWKRSFSSSRICCQGSLWRGLGMIPFIASGTLNDNPTILLYLSGDHTLPLAGNQAAVQLHIDTRYPETGDISIAVNPPSTTSFTLQLYVPSWCSTYTAVVNGQTYFGTPGTFLGLNRLWTSHDTVKVTMPLRTRLVWDGNSTTPRQFAIQRGPQLLSVDDTITGTTLPPAWGGTQVYDIAIKQNGQTIHRIMVPYAEAGQLGISNFTTVGDSVYLAANDSVTAALANRVIPGRQPLRLGFSNHSIVVPPGNGEYGSLRAVVAYKMNGTTVFDYSNSGKSAEAGRLIIPVAAAGMYVVSVKYERTEFRQVVSCTGNQTATAR